MRDNRVREQPGECVRGDGKVADTANHANAKVARDIVAGKGSRDVPQCRGIVEGVARHREGSLWRRADAHCALEVRAEGRWQTRLVNRVASNVQRREVGADEDAVAIGRAAEARVATDRGAIVTDDVLGDGERRAAQFPDAVVVVRDDVVDDLQAVNTARSGNTSASNMAGVTM